MQYNKFLKKTHYNSLKKELKTVISRINSVYGRWKRDTPVEKMRSDWDQLYVGAQISATTEDFEVEGIACRWVRAPEIDGPAVVLYVHGGGFRLGSIDSHRKLMSDIACDAKCRVLGFNYSLMPEAQYPTQLDEAIRVYRWLLDQGYSARNVIFAGDSAGGGIAAAMLQKIKQDPTLSLPLPAGIVLLSAWLDMTLSGESYSTRQAQDPVHQAKMLESLAHQYSGAGASLSDPLLSPAFGDLTDLPPTLLQVGDCEIGLSDSTAYAEKMESAGGKVSLSVWPNMIHVFQMYADDLPDGKNAIRAIADFVRAVVKRNAQKPIVYVSQAKVTPPPQPVQQLERQELAAMLSDRQSARKVTILQAPAGYGKSTTMAQAQKRLEDQGASTVWMNFDDADNDVSRFLAVFSVALAPHFDRLEESSYQTLRNQDLLQRMIEYLDVATHPTAFFFDNFEAIQNPAILSLIDRGIDAMPENCNVYIGTRTPPKIGLAKLEARAQLTTVGVEELRFSEKESENLLQQKFNAELPLLQTQQLHKRTDGWPVAMTLAALALQGKSNAEGYIAKFSGTNAAVAAYLAQEVLGSLPEATQDFLLQASIFDEVDASICDRVLKRTDSQEVLDELQERHLFVTSSKAQPELFHYHNLFRDFLYTQLQRRQSDRINDLHRAAAKVYLNEERAIPATRHFLKAGDTDQALKLLDVRAERLLGQGRIGLLARLLDQVPVRSLDEHPHLKQIYALCVTYTRGPKPAYELLADMDETALPAESAAYLLALRPLQLGMMDHIEEAHAQGLDAVEKLVDSAPNANIILSQALTQTSIILGEHEMARQFCDQARYTPGSSVDVFNLVLAESAESGMELMAGRLKQASNRINLAIERQRNDRSHRSRGVSMASIQRAEILYEQGDIATARRLLATNSALVQDMGPPDALITANVILSRIVADEGEPEYASQLLIELENSGHRLQLPRVVASARLERSRLWLAQGDTKGAREQLDLAVSTYDWEQAKDYWYSANDTLTPSISEIRWLTRTGQSAEALPLARNLLKAAEHAHHARRALKLRILLAECQHNHGDRRSALRTMSQALDFATEEGFVRTFMEEGPTLQPIFAEMGIAPPTAALGSTKGQNTAAPSPASPQQANAAMPSEIRLTKKEMDVLAVLAMGLSNVAMAQKLFVSESTVRTHLRNINSKLNASNRTEAVNIARQIGLIS